MRRFGVDKPDLRHGNEIKSVDTGAEDVGSLFGLSSKSSLKFVQFSVPKGKTISNADLKQVESVANRFYGDLEELSLLTVDLDRIESDVRWEPPAPGADELYPHIYGPLPVSAVTAVRTWRRSGGDWSLELGN